PSHRRTPSRTWASLTSGLQFIAVYFFWLLAPLRVALLDCLGVAGLVDLRDAADREGAVGDVLDDRRAGRDDGALSHAHGRDELRVGADERAVLDDGLPLLVAVVVAGDRARAD